MSPSPRSRILVEVAIGSASDAITAEAAGADRLELNSALGLGGLTPSLGLAEAVLEATRLPVFAMIRARPGGFDYRDDELAAMIRDIDRLGRLPVAGFVFGVLTADGRPDPGRNRRLRDAARDLPCVFHRAFDVTPEPAEALETLIGLGFRRILTSGQAPTAHEGAGRIAESRRQAAGRIEILPGAGVRPGNAVDLIERTGCDQIHGTFRTQIVDTSTAARPGIRFGPGEEGPGTRVDVADGAAIAEVVTCMRASFPAR